MTGIRKLKHTHVLVLTLQTFNNCLSRGALIGFLEKKNFSNFSQSTGGLIALNLNSPAISLIELLGFFPQNPW